MSRNSIRPEQTAFVFKVKFKDLLDAIEGTPYRVGRLLDDNANVLVTGIDENNEIKFSRHLLLDDSHFDQIQYAKLLIALENDLSYLVLKSERLSRTGVTMDQRRLTPILRFKNGIIAAQELGIQPWHHLLFSGDFVYVYIWDTRVVERVLANDECKCLTPRMFVDAPDNNVPLCFTEQTEMYREAFDQMLPTKHKMFSGNMTITEELKNYITEQP